MWRTQRARAVPEEIERDRKCKLLILFVIIQIKKKREAKSSGSAAGKLLQNKEVKRISTLETGG
jgi:hypothetical protein